MIGYFDLGWPDPSLLVSGSWLDFSSVVGPCSSYNFAARKLLDDGDLNIEITWLECDGTAAMLLLLMKT
ncbi:hypothetical protein ACLOJK_008236 [Asimina triloba]